MVQTRSLRLLSTLFTLSTFSFSVFAKLSSVPSKPLVDLDAQGLFDGVMPDPSQLDFTNHSLQNPYSYHQLVLKHPVNPNKAEKSTGWHKSRSLPKEWTGTAKIHNTGTTGVSAMQATPVDDTTILFYDKAEKNALQVGGQSAWAALFSIVTLEVRPLLINTNSFCAGGGWLGNGTLMSIGGNPNQNSAETNAFDGLSAVRMFTPCNDDSEPGTCGVYENLKRIHLTSRRWYPSTCRMTDGSILIAGGMIAGGYNNALATDNPSFEFFPPKGDGLSIYSTFLHDALNTNLFPLMYLLPNGLVFVGANKLSMLYNPTTNTEQRLPDLPGGTRFNYPASTASCIMPFTIANGYTPTVLVCGGSTANTEVDPDTLSAAYPASTICSLMTLTTAGIKDGWIQKDNMPTPRVMGDAILMPDGMILIINGAKDGVAGYGNVLDEVGSSNSKTPNYSPVLYNPLEPLGSRFTAGFPSSTIERLYHSTASLLPDGRVGMWGSNPNDDVSDVTFETRYNAEIFYPPYCYQTRPTFTGLPASISWGKAFTLTVGLPAGTKVVQVSLMDLGFSTHGVHMDNRLVELACTLSGTKLTVTGPISRGLFPPATAGFTLLQTVFLVLERGSWLEAHPVLPSTRRPLPTCSSRQRMLLKPLKLKRFRFLFLLLRTHLLTRAPSYFLYSD